MKNLLIYTSPTKQFNKENSSYIKIQIDNSLNYWRKEDILLITNFPYEYHGIEAIIVPFEKDVLRNKFDVIIYLLESKIIDELTWFHDTEAWQLAPLKLELHKGLGLTDYGWSKRWNGGSMFFHPRTLDIFKWLQADINRRHKGDETALMNLTRRNYNNVNERIQCLNITYNLGKRHMTENLLIADKPIRVAHFHPYRSNLLAKFKPLLPENLYKLFYEEYTNICQS
jgi:hypothetical protein